MNETGKPLEKKAGRGLQGEEWEGSNNQFAGFLGGEEGRLMKWSTIRCVMVP